MSRETLSNGCHYWKVRIDQFTGTSNNGFVAIGAAKELDDGRPIGNKERCDCVILLTGGFGYQLGNKERCDCVILLTGGFGYQLS